MSLPTFLARPPTGQIGAKVFVDAEEYHHLRVRRLREGDRVRIIDGKGRAYLGTVERLGKERAEVRIVDACKDGGESPLETTLALPFVREERVAYALEKATELGVTRIVVFRSQRGRPYDPAARLRRWQRIVTEAAKQCQRSFVPTLTCLPSIEPLVAVDPTTLALLLHPHEPTAGEQKSPPWSKHPWCRVTVVVGPEGGFTDEEIAVLEAAGFLRLNLGPRILRTETAVVVALTLLQFLWGDLQPARARSTVQLREPV